MVFLKYFNFVIYIYKINKMLFCYILFLELIICFIIIDLILYFNIYFQNGLYFIISLFLNLNHSNINLVVSLVSWLSSNV